MSHEEPTGTNEFTGETGPTEGTEPTGPTGETGTSGHIFFPKFSE